MYTGPAHVWLYLRAAIKQQVVVAATAANTCQIR